MQNSRKVQIVITIFLTLLATLLMQHLVRDHSTGQQKEVNRSPEIINVLEALTLPLPSKTSTNYSATLRMATRRRQEAIEQLQTNQPVLLPQIIEEVINVGGMERTNRTAAAAMTAQLALAFEVLGPDASPLLPRLKKEFAQGRSVGPCVAAFQHIGSTEAGLILVSGLTNSDRMVRNACMSVIGSFSENRAVTQKAVAPLIASLNDSSPFVRSLAASGLGTFSQNADVVVPRLVALARSDSNVVVRSMALKSIGQFGTNAAGVRLELKRVLETERERSVREIAENALKAVTGETRSDASFQ